MRDSESLSPITALPARQGRGIPFRFALAMLAGLALTEALRGFGMSGGSGDWLVAQSLFLIAGVFTGLMLRRGYHHPRLGACNIVTLMRVALTSALIPPLLSGAAGGMVIAILAGVTLSLDGLDGWLARRSGLTSGFGARFDIEADAVFALVLTLHALAKGFGPEVLALGVTRYAFVAAGWVWPWLTAPLAPSFRRKFICVVQMVVLIALQIIDPAMPFAELLIWAAIFALFWSFGTDIRTVWRGRK